MATDTAFAVALIAMMGARVPVELRVFLTAAAIVDDIGAIVVVAIFYSGALDPGYLAAAAAVTAGLALLNRWRVYSVTPYALLGVALWACVHAGGLHATLAGVVLALFIPTRPPANLRALMVQANTILAAEARHSGEVLRHGPVAAGAARARRHPRPAGIAGRPAAAARRRAVELRGAAAVRAGERRGGGRAGGAGGPRGADARDRRRGWWWASRSAWWRCRRWRCGSGSR